MINVIDLNTLTHVPQSILKTYQIMSFNISYPQGRKKEESCKFIYLRKQNYFMRGIDVIKPAICRVSVLLALEKSAVSFFAEIRKCNFQYRD